MTPIAHVTRYPRDPDNTWARLHKMRSKEQLGPRRHRGVVKAKQGQAGLMIDPNFVGVKTCDLRSLDPILRHVGGVKA